jgi:hypothetical protein
LVDVVVTSAKDAPAKTQYNHAMGQGDRQANILAVVAIMASGVMR